jgi:nucleotide-binding universal stress UspA family protein
MDLSPASLRAFHFASEIAVRCEATLLIADIVPAEERFLTKYRRMINDLEQKIGISVRQAEGGEIRDIRRNAPIKYGGIGSLLATEAAQQNVDLIVLGTDGWTGIKKFNEGSKAEEIAHSVTIPVLTIGPNVTRGPEFKRLLYVTDFSPTAAKAILYAVSLARKYRASLDVLHVNDPGTDETPRRAAERMSIFGRDEIEVTGLATSLVARSYCSEKRRNVLFNSPQTETST